MRVKNIRVCAECGAEKEMTCTLSPAKYNATIRYCQSCSEKRRYRTVRIRAIRDVIHEFQCCIDDVNHFITGNSELLVRMIEYRVKKLREQIFKLSTDDMITKLNSIRVKSK